jgi:tryptophan synthase alpha subunit
MTIIMQYLSYALRSFVMNTVVVDVDGSVLPDVGPRNETYSRDFCMYLDVFTVHLVQFTIQTNKSTIYIYI